MQNINKKVYIYIFIQKKVISHAQLPEIIIENNVGAP